MRLFEGTIVQDGSTNDATTQVITNGFPYDLTPANLTLARQSAGVYELSNALNSLLTDNNAVISLTCTPQYNGGVVMFDNTTQRLIHKDENGILCDGFAASISIKKYD